MQLFLIRHPRPLIESGICYGQLDVDCEDPGICAKRIKPLLPENIPVFSSPLRRARRLAEALSANVQIDERLREIHFGEWEEKPWSEIDCHELNAWAEDLLHFVPPGGESVAALQARALDFVVTLNLPCAAVVTHAGIMRALLGHWQQMPVEDWAQLQFGFGELVSLDIDRKKFSLAQP